MSTPDVLGGLEAPVFQTAAFNYQTAEDMASVFAGRAPGHLYTRLSNPTTLTLERRLADLEGGLGAISTSSGMAAIAAVMTGLLRPGDEVVSASAIFGGTISFFRNVLGRFGVRTTFVPAEDTAAFATAITPATRVLFVETIGNPGMDVPDLTALADLAHNHKIPLVVDSTLTTPALIRPGTFGADLVVHSTSKFLNGHGSSIGGAIVDTGRFNWAASPFADVAALAKRAGRQAFLAHLRTSIARDLGACSAPWTSFLVLQGLETLSARMRLHCENALGLANFLRQRSDVAAVNYPGLPDSPHFERVQRYLGGKGGGLLTLGLGSQKRAFAFINNLRRARLVANLGETRTLVIHPASTIFREYDQADRHRMGVPDDLVRVSVGIEDLSTIVEDFRQALESSHKEPT